MAIRKYYLLNSKDGHLYEVRTYLNVPSILPVHGIFCTRCGSMYPEDGSIDAAMQLGCDCCHSLSSFRNVYLWDGNDLEKR